MITNAGETATFNSSFGNGTNVVVDSGSGIGSIQEVFDAVRNGEVCVSGGDYFWNNKKAMDQIQQQISSKEGSCIAIG
jgi:hypothetical protein